MTRPLRVLINGLHAKTGGGVTYLRAILPRLAAEPDLEFRLLIHESQRDLYQASPDGVDIQLVAFKDGFIRRLLWEQLVLPLHAWSRADVTFSPANYGPLLAPRPVVLLRNALDVTQVENRLSKKLYWLVLGIMTWLSLLAAPVAIAVSAYARRRLAFGFAKKVRVIHHGVEHEVFHPGDAPRESFLLAVGDLTVQKNLHTLIEAISGLPDLELHIAGREVDADYANALKMKAQALGVVDRAKFLGPLSAQSLAQMYRRCKIFAFPSTVETFGNPLVEAMASGATIISSNRAAMPEILGPAGCYAEADQAADWADKIGTLLGDEARQAELRAAALERAALFSWERTARETADQLRHAGRAATNPLLAAFAGLWLVAAFLIYLLQFRTLLPTLVERISSLP